MFITADAKIQFKNKLKPHLIQNSIEHINSYGKGYNDKAEATNTNIKYLALHRPIADRTCYLVPQHAMCHITTNECISLYCIKKNSTNFEQVNHDSKTRENVIRSNLGMISGHAIQIYGDNNDF